MAKDGYTAVCLAHQEAPAEDCHTCLMAEHFNQPKPYGYRNLMDIGQFDGKPQNTDHPIIDHVHGPQPGDHPTVTGHIVYIGDKCPICFDDERADDYKERLANTINHWRNHGN